MKKETVKDDGGGAKRPTSIKGCNCHHDYQDQKYGRGNRVFNPMKSMTWRCTVCRKVS